MKIAMVTGAGTGIGKATALAFLRDGWAVVLAGRRSELLMQTKSEAPEGTPPVTPPETSVGVMLSLPAVPTIVAMRLHSLVRLMACLPPS